MIPLSRGVRTSIRCMWLLTVGTVILGSLAPAASAPLRVLGSLDINDKIQHFLAYLPLAMLPMLSETRKRAMICVVIMVLLGIALEFGQMLSQGRSAEPLDALADTFGLLTGIAVAVGVRRLYS